MSDPEPGLIDRGFFWADRKGRWHGPFVTYEGARADRDAEFWRPRPDVLGRILKEPANHDSGAQS